MPKVRLVWGDCIAKMAEMERDSVDAIVCDPPYNLSNSDKRDTDCLRRILSKVFLPKHDQGNVEFSQSIDLSIPSVSSTDLSGELGTIGVDSGIGMPEGSIDFKGDPINYKINASGPTASGITNEDLSVVVDVDSVEDDSYFVFELANTPDATFCDGTCSCFSEPVPGVIAMSVIVAGSTGSNLSSNSIRTTRSSNAGIGLGNDPLGEPSTASSVLTSRRTERRAMLCLNLVGRTAELLPAERTLHEDLPIGFLRSKQVGAFSGASGLASPLEPNGISEVDAFAYGAITLDWFPWHKINQSVAKSGFMGKAWDGWESPAAFQRWTKAWAEQAYRVLKPGGHLLSFGGTRTFHRMAVGIEDAGFEIRDSIFNWVYGQGFPKSQDVGIEIRTNQMLKGQPRTGTFDGFGTALKPAVEPIVLARKPLAAKTVAANVMRYGTGALNIDASRIGTSEADREQMIKMSQGFVGKPMGSAHHYNYGYEDSMPIKTLSEPHAQGRFPANIILQHSASCVQVGERIEPGVVINTFDDGAKPFGNGAGHPYTSITGPQSMAAVYRCQPGCPIAELDSQSGIHTTSQPGKVIKRESAKGAARSNSIGAESRLEGSEMIAYGDTGGASRFFQTFDAEPQHLDGCVLVASTNQCVEGCPIKALDEQSGIRPGCKTPSNARNVTSIYRPGQEGYQTQGPIYPESGGASRYFQTFDAEHDQSTEQATIEENLAQSPGFFYQAKAAKRERNLGLVGIVNNHSTVKPVKLLSYLVKLVTPPGGTVLDPFMGSGTTGVAAINNGFGFIGIEKEPEYKAIARARIKHAIDQKINPSK